MLKAVVARPRPEGVDFGFPSGHATGAAAFMSGIIFGVETLRSAFRRLVTVVACATIVLVAVARVVLHADVLGGVLLGVVFTTCAAIVTADEAADDRLPRM